MKDYSFARDLMNDVINGRALEAGTLVLSPAWDPAQAQRLQQIHVEVKSLRDALSALTVVEDNTTYVGDQAFFRKAAADEWAYQFTNAIEGTNYPEDVPFRPVVPNDVPAPEDLPFTRVVPDPTETPVGVPGPGQPAEPKESPASDPEKANPPFAPVKPGSRPEEIEQGTTQETSVPDDGGSADDDEHLTSGDGDEGTEKEIEETTTRKARRGRKAKTMVTDRVVREWAVQHGIEIGDRGRVAGRVRELYLAAAA